jgi:hypothetical protein
LVCDTLFDASVASLRFQCVEQRSAPLLRQFGEGFKIGDRVEMKEIVIVRNQALHVAQDRFAALRHFRERMRFDGWPRESSDRSGFVALAFGAGQSDVGLERFANCRRPGQNGICVEAFALKPARAKVHFGKSFRESEFFGEICGFVSGEAVVVFGLRAISKLKRPAPRPAFYQFFVCLD